MASAKKDIHCKILIGKGAIKLASEQGYWVLFVLYSLHKVCTEYTE